MSRVPIKQFFNDLSRSLRLLKKEGSYREYAYNVLKRFQWSKADGDELKGKKGYDKLENKPTIYDSEMRNYSPEENDLNSYNNKWKPEIAWLGKALEQALQLYKWALPTGDGIENKPPPTDRSLAEIFSSIQRSKLGVQDWSLSDLTIGLYLVYLQQASTSAVEDVKGELICSESIVQDLIYHIELAKGAYKDSATGLARNSMLREKDVVKFIKHSSVLRPGYYIGIDKRKKLVILGIRGTHTVYDLITDIISSGHEDITFEGYSTHFGTAESARWFLNHEMDTIRKCLEKHKDFRLRLVGHSLGGATASLLAIMLRKKSLRELGFSPDIITAVGYATPPCVSKELAESCSDFVTTVVMQDDIIPRLSVASLTRLRNEIVETDWVSVLSREDWKGVIDLVTNAKQVVSSVQDVARKLADYAKFRGQTKHSGILCILVELDMPMKKEVSTVPSFSQTSNPPSGSPSLCPSSDQEKLEKTTDKVAEDLFVPGTLYYLKRNVDADSHHKHTEYFTLLRRQPSEHFQKILLSSNIISDHKCDSHYYALRDVLKGLPSSSDDRTIDN
ncbi:Sn1-specific diacylglycerol lipase beta [Sesamum angolense]|uniref:Sn1-specific diacylglycerol lipase beta n=1 Tax=Sesamum angolense TaxID=2727404 RepID=A0AAE1XAA5_9LAMI|nr:Sn1-specific diacylglycerol lipase beta [Sesamum angolense]